MKEMKKFVLGGLIIGFLLGLISSIIRILINIKYIKLPDVLIILFIYPIILGIVGVLISLFLKLMITEKFPLIWGMMFGAITGFVLAFLSMGNSIIAIFTFIPSMLANLTNCRVWECIFPFFLFSILFYGIIGGIIGYIIKIKKKK